MNPQIDQKKLLETLPADIVQYSIRPYYNQGLHRFLVAVKAEDIPQNVINSFIKRVDPSRITNITAGGLKDLVQEAIEYNALDDILEEANLVTEVKQSLLQNTPLDVTGYYAVVLGSMIDNDYNNKEDLDEQIERLSQSINNGYVDEIGIDTYIQEMLESRAIEDFDPSEFDPSEFEFKSSKKRKSKSKKKRKSRRRKSKKKSPKRKKSKRKSKSRKKSKRKSSRRKSKSKRKSSRRKSKSKGVMNKQSSAYKKAKRMADEKFGEKTSAYKSMYIVRMYKKHGGRFSKSRDKNRGLTRWNREKWIRINPKTGKPLRRSGKLVRCGRSKKEFNNNEGKGLCRPYKRISKKTPKTAKQLGKREMKRRSRIKRKNPDRYVRSKKRRSRRK